METPLVASMVDTLAAGCAHPRKTGMLADSMVASDQGPVQLGVFGFIGMLVNP